ncbi:DUF202 domain-containing protein [Nocardia xishanensis]|uniref:DUF202 domain-containing protein n=1 Tax=Nocardia xishanensis TaxID=238964 RepID=UPI0033FCBBA6
MTVAERDPGLQAERTALAWRRTAASAMGVALLLAHFAVRLGDALAGVIPLAAALGLIVLAGAAYRRGRRLRISYDSTIGPVALLVAGTVVTVSATVAIVSISLQ